MSAAPRLLVDATDCSVKAEIYRLAARYGLKVLLVSADDIGAPFEAWLTKVVVGESGTVAEAILAETRPVDVVVTDNPALAEKLLARTARLFTTKGQRWTLEGPMPKLLTSARKSTRARFESVLEDELKAVYWGNLIDP